MVWYGYCSCNELLCHRAVLYPYCIDYCLGILWRLDEESLRIVTGMAHVTGGGRGRAARKGKVDHGRRASLDGASGGRAGQGDLGLRGAGITLQSGQALKREARMYMPT